MRYIEKLSLEEKYEEEMGKIRGASDEAVVGLKADEDTQDQKQHEDTKDDGTQGSKKKRYFLTKGDIEREIGGEFLAQGEFYQPPEISGEKKPQPTDSVPFDVVDHGHNKETNMVFYKIHVPGPGENKKKE